MRVATVTPNPAIDQTITVERLRPGEVHRALLIRQDAGGKGVNVASCLADWGLPVVAFGLLGADNATLFEKLYTDKGIKDQFQRMPGETRVNLKIVDDVQTTDINMGGATVDPERIEHLATAIVNFAVPGTRIVLSGSLPPGCPPNLYADLVGRLKNRGAQVLLDTSGQPLSLALKARVLPDIIKPNRCELTLWGDEPLDTLDDVVRVAVRLHEQGIALVVVSMGEQGALFVSEEGVLVASLPAGTVASTVGAGDAMVAGIVAALAEGGPLERIARLSTAFAVAKLGQLGPHLPDLRSVRALTHDVLITRAKQASNAFAGDRA